LFVSYCVKNLDWFIWLPTHDRFAQALQEVLVRFWVQDIVMLNQLVPVFAFPDVSFAKIVMLYLPVRFVFVKLPM
jgi:hypothetical protein